MRQVVLHDGADFAQWRAQARALLHEGVQPSQVHWQVGPHAAGLLPVDPSPLSASPTTSASVVPRDFLALAQTVLAHADVSRHARLYRVLWRLTHGEPQLLRMATDDDVVWVSLAAKAVRRDQHKMKAFVRFREVQDAHGPLFVAWFEPTHDILPRVAPFFVRRFAGMRWSILTPTRSAFWDGQTLAFGAGAQRSDAPADDALEHLWLTYFTHIFNPARLKVDAMRKEMPVRYWKNMPETELIPGMIRDASARMEAMVRSAPGTPKKNIPAPLPRAPAVLPGGSLAELQQQVGDCRACPLWQAATQSVFGEGPPNARVVVIGEQPGDQEDLAGRPFIGPAGQLLNRALTQAGVDRSALYVTNAVKHFKFEPRGKRRLHARASAQEQAACRHWLQAELDRIAPIAIVCLGAIAAQAIFGSGFRLLDQRGRWHTLDNGIRAFATVHPSHVLRLPDHRQRDQAFEGLARDLALLRSVLD